MFFFLTLKGAHDPATTLSQRDTEGLFTLLSPTEPNQAVNEPVRFGSGWHR